MKLGFIGLGTMGAPMALNLLSAGHELKVFNRTPARVLALKAAGAIPAATARACAENVDALLLSVSDSKDVFDVLFEREDAAMAGLAPGALVIDTSTIAPEAAREAARRLVEIGAGFVDAPVSGGSEGARNGTLAIMCGASASNFRRAQPILAMLGRSIVHVGEVGAGSVAKAVNQVIIAGTYQSVAEGMVLALKCGVDPRAVLPAIDGGAAASWVLANRAANMIADDYPLGFRMALHRKDLRIALDAAAKSGCALPLASLIASFEDALIAAGRGDEDMSALARTVRAAAALPPGPMTVTTGDRS